ncbi:MAG: hypothetical protein Q8M16_14320 [Pirellulaceae bacterium]|nr:hypothetical protein [Pirellulaceae bacterium]
MSNRKTPEPLMQTTQKLFQVFVQRDQQRRPSRWFSRESLAKRYCDEFNIQSELGSKAQELAEIGSSLARQEVSGRAVAVYQLVEIPVNRPKVMAIYSNTHPK